MSVIRILAAVLVLVPAAAFAQTQSLVDVATAEEARRKTVNKPAKVYTNGDLRSDFTVPAPPPPATSPAAGTAEPAPAAAATVDPAVAKTPAAGSATPQRDQAYWKGRITEAKDKLERSKMFVDALQSRINALTTQVINRDDPYQQRTLEQERQKNIAELDRVKRDIDAETKAIAAIEDEARRAGVPPGWLR